MTLPGSGRGLRHPPLPCGHHRPAGHPNRPDPEERARLEGRLPGSEGSERDAPRHETLRSGVLEILDRIPRPKPRRGEDAMPQVVRRAHRRKRPRPTDRRDPHPHCAHEPLQPPSAPPRSSARPDIGGKRGTSRFKREFCNNAIRSKNSNQTHRKIPTARKACSPVRRKPRTCEPVSTMPSACLASSASINSWPASLTHRRYGLWKPNLEGPAILFSRVRREQCT